MAVANQLASANVVAVIGPMCSGAAVPAAKVLAEENIPMISPSATSPSLTEQGMSTVFRTCGRDDQQGAAIADLIAGRYAGQAVAILQDKTAYGQGLADVVKRDLNQKGIKEKLYESITRGERDFATLVSKLKQNNIGVVFFGGYHTEAGLIMRQMRDQGLKAAFIGDDDMTTREFWSITGAAGEGAMMSFNPDPRLKPEAANAVARIRAKGFEPEGTTLYTYAAVQVVADAVRQAGTTDGAKVSRAIHNSSYPTVVGLLTFDKKGDVTTPDYIIYVWHNGNYEPLKD